MSSFISYFVQPYVIALLAIATGLVVAWRKIPERRRKLLPVIVAFLVLVVVSTPVVGGIAVATLEWQYPPLAERPQEVDAVVVLGGGVLPPKGFRAEAELAPPSVYRCVYAAALYAQGRPCVVLVTGGKSRPFPGPDCADLMRQLLLRLGVADEFILTAHNSKTTYDDVREGQLLLEKRGARKIAVVSDAYHVPRAVGCFRKAGFEVTPAGCQHLVPTLWETSLLDFFPQQNGLALFETAAHEWFGILWYRLRGRL